VGTIAERERLARNVIRLRRAEQASPGNTDVAEVRADLERAVGRTIPRATAARLLGISQTALDRWIAHGDIPVVVTPAGRREVPLAQLVELAAAVSERADSVDERHPLAAILRERRSIADDLDARSLFPRGRPRELDRGGHARADLRAFAYHRAVARRLDERLIADARDLLRRWRDEGRIDPRDADGWEQILSRPPTEVARFIKSDSARARELRQSSPFAGALTEPERMRVLELTR
jgi:hypothetical protein